MRIKACNFELKYTVFGSPQFSSCTVLSQGTYGHISPTLQGTVGKRGGQL